MAEHLFTITVIIFLSVDFTLSKLNVLTWRENYAGSSGLTKRSADLMNTRTADGVRVTKSSIVFLKEISTVEIS